MRIPRTPVLIRIAVLLTTAGMLMLIPILLEISALNVGLVMLGSALIGLGLVLYLLAVVRDLRRREAL